MSAPGSPPYPSAKSLVAATSKLVTHPSTNSAAGLVLAALSQFTAAVPVHDRTTPTLLGLGYSLAVQVIDWLKSATKTA